tara:strand:+ start:3614 stop:7474 length:3861 start_codon:yes stop_codon:yes gene_type:complete
MPEIKKVFVRGKMNQDLDERLVPRGEYREGQNIQVSNSEDDDVGAVENVLGNKLAYSTALANVGDECIGYYVDVANNRIFWFTTDYSEESEADIISMPRAATNKKMAIIMKNGDQEPQILVSGLFLNFNKKFLITGVNVIDNYLYWTDNYNQPRYIDINKADSQHPNYAGAGYYNCEDKISVAKVAPYECPLLNQSNSGVPHGNNADGTTLVRDANVDSDFMQERFLRFAYRYKYDNGQYSIISPFTQSVFKPLNDGQLKHTRDQRNSTANEPDVPISTLDVVRKTTLDIMQNAYNKITMRIPLPKLDEFAGGVNPGSTYANDFSIDKVEILLKESDGLAVKLIDEIQLDDASAVFGSYYQSIDDNTVTVDGALNNANSTSNLDLVVDHIVSAKVNGAGQAGNTFVIDNISPSISDLSTGMRVISGSIGATQEVRIRSINTGNSSITLEDINGNLVANDTSIGADNAELRFINFVGTGWIHDNTSTAVVGSEGYLYVTGITLNGSNKVQISMNKGISVADGAPLVWKKVYWRQHVEYIYRSEKPYKVLPEKQLLRTSDKTPVRAKAQEIVGNRLVYGNITENYDLPLDTNNREGIDYTIGSTIKSENEYNKNSGYFQHNKTVYKHHNLKQRRTYKVGVVLSDKYGRKSPVILSTNTDNADVSDTFTLPADIENKQAKFGGNYSWSTNQETIGKALEITFRDDYIVQAAKAYNQVSNPNGWYSWRIVVKQTEQDYYNIYTNYTANSWSNTSSTRTAQQGTSNKQIINGQVNTGSAGRSWLTLHGDNINKVPRDVEKEYDFDREGLAGSEIELWPKVIPIDAAGTSTSVHQAAGQEYIKVLSIGTAVEQGLFQGSEGDLGGSTELKAKRRIYKFVYNNESNPLVAELPNLKVEPVGIDNIDVNVPDVNNEAQDLPFGLPGDPNIGVAESPQYSSSGLMVFETKPVESKIDIFYETATGGLIKDLNDIIEVSPSTGPSNISISNSSFTENSAINTFIGNVTAVITTAAITNVQVLNAVDGNNNSYTTAFNAILSGSNWQLRTADTFVFRNDSGRDTFTLTLKVTQTGGLSTTGNVSVNVTNSNPSIASGSGPVVEGASSGTIIGSVAATNGSAKTSSNKNFIIPGNVTEPIGGQNIVGLELDQSPAGNIRLKTNANYNENSLFPGNTITKSVTLNISDNGGLTASSTFNITIMRSTSIQGWAITGGSAGSACTIKCGGANAVTYYAVQGSGSNAPTSSNIYTNNIIYTDSLQQNRLFAGTSGRFAFDGDGAEYEVNNGVVGSASQLCPC